MVGTSRIRGRGVWIVALVVASALVLPGTVSAQAVAPRQHAFDIAPQALPDALAEFARQARVQISAHGDLARGVASTGVRGTMSIDAALARLLAGTDLSWRHEAGGTVVLQSAAGTGSSLRLGPILVPGDAGFDAHAGAADRTGSLYITREDLERRNPTTVKQVFAGESGVSVGGAQPLSQKVYVHGVEETNLAVSVDGARQNNRIFHHSGTNLIDPSLLELARVDPGVAPADAGAGALAGAIVYETVDAGDLLAPGRNAGGFITSRFNSNGATFDNGASGYARAGGFEVLGFVKYARGDEYDDGRGNEVAGTQTDLTSLLGKAAFEDGGHRLELSAERVRDHAPRPFRANIGNLLNRNDPPVRDYRLARENYVAEYSTPAAGGLLDPRLVLGYSASELDVPVPFGSTGISSSVSARAENEFHVSPGNSVTAGVDFYNDAARYHDPSDKMSEHADNAGVYAQARLTPLERLRVSFGLRADRQWFQGIDGSEIEHSGVSGNLSGAFDLSEQVTVTAGYSSVWGGIALAENFIMNTNWSYAGGIDPVRANNLTTGISFTHAGFNAGAAVFRSEFDDARAPTFGGGPGLTTDFRTRGYEVRGGFEWLSGFVRASFTDTRIKVNGAAANTFITQYLGTPLGRVIAVELAQQIGAGLSVGGTVDAALNNQDTVAAGGQMLPGYKVFSAYAEYRPPGADFLTLRVEANNLFDESHADRATYGQDFAVVAPLREPGRSFMFMVKATF